MKDVPVERTRNWALIGHSGDGKTALGEALLFKAGALQAPGDITQGQSALTTLPEEKERQGSSMAPAVYSFDTNGYHCTLVDTPGDPNFQPSGLIALHALDAAILIVSAADGAKVGTERMWRAARELGLTVLTFVSGLDRDRADFAATVESLNKMEMKPAVLSLPIGAGADFTGVVDLVSMRVWTADGEGEVPAELADEVEQARQRLVEAVAECDDELLEKYLEEGELGDEEVARGLVAGVRDGAITPVCAGSALSGIGVDSLLRAVFELVPSPAEGRTFAAQTIRDGADCEVEADPEAPFSAVVFKTAIDRYAGTLSVFRVVSGRVHSDESILDATSNTKQRLGKLHLLRGAEHEETDEAGPGDIVAVAKLKDTHTGDVLTAERGGVRLAKIPIPHGVLSYAIEAKSKGDEDKLFSSLARIVEEDPTLQVERDPRTGQFLLTGMGELHIRSVVEKLKRMFNLEIRLERPKVPYRETVTRKAEHIEGKLKKQTGGKGMFGVCYLTVEPLPRGEGLQFVDEIVGGAIPRGLIPAVEKGVLEACERGPLAGYPVVDVRVRCIDGKHHSVDSNEMAFKLAGSMGFKTAAERAKPTLLEPVMDVEVAAPDESIGDVIGDLNSRRGRVQSTDSKGSTSVIKAQVPMAEMLEYASVLTSLTGGKGAFHMEFSHYDELPAQIRDKVVEEARAASEEN